MAGLNTACQPKLARNVCSWPGLPPRSIGRALRTVHGGVGGQIGSADACLSRANNRIHTHAAVVGTEVVQTPRLETQAQQQSEQFLWERQWWPVLLVEHLDTKKPHAVTLLGRRFVVWHAGDGTWRCFDDVCPHRLAPLSEGRIETDGTLQCSYHGWRFNEQGRCTLIPQSEDAKAAATACASPRSAVRSYPTQVQASILWVFPDPSPDSHIHAAAKTPPVPDYLHEHVKNRPMAGFMRDLPYSYEVLLENLLDPSHLPFSHSGVGQLHREQGGPVPMGDATDDPSNDATCMTWILKDVIPGPQVPGNNLKFFAPQHVRYYRPLPGDGFSSVVLFLTPTMPGRSRVFLFNVFKIVTIQRSMMGRLRAVLFRLLMPVWFAHLKFSHSIFDGDGVFLHHQDNHMRVNGKTYKNYYTPTTADTMVLKARQWVHTVGGGGPSFPDNLPPPPVEMPRSVLLDRYESHTKHCKACSTAVERLQQLRSAAVVVGGAMFLALCAAAGTYGAGIASAAAGVKWAVGGAAAVLVACMVAYSQLGPLIQQFFFVDYVHAYRD